MKKILLICAIVAGCATGTPNTIKVDVPVYTPCVIQKLDTPDFAVDSLPLGSDIWSQMNSLRAERIQRKAYEAELEKAIEACQK